MNAKPENLPGPYRWVVERGLVGFEPFTALQPWYFLNEEDVFSATEKWPTGPSTVALLAFARRQDCDDIACFEPSKGDTNAVTVIQGWTSQGQGYEIVTRCATFWDWMKSVIDDIAEWSDLPRKL